MIFGRGVDLKILIISTFFPPLNSIASLRPYSWAKQWTLDGHDVTVLTHEKVQNSTTALSCSNPGYKVIEVPLPSWLRRLKQIYGEQQEARDLTYLSSRNNSLPKRLTRPLRKLFDAIRSSRGILNACRMPDLTDLWIRPALSKALHLSDSWDLLVSTSGPYAVHAVASGLKRRHRVKTWIADYRDTWTENHIYPGLFPFTLLEKGLEWHWLKRADAITTVSQPLQQLLAKKFDKKKVTVIENGFDLDDLMTLNPSNAFPDDGKLHLVHTGSLYPHKQKPEALFAAIRQLAGSPHFKLLEQLELLFVGPPQPYLGKLIEAYGVGAWTKIGGLVSREKALCLQRDAHYLLFFPWSDTSVDGILTGKLFEYLFSGTPILATGGAGIEASQRLIADSRTGICLGNDVDRICAFLVDKLSCIKKETVPIDTATTKAYTRQALAAKFLDLALTLV